VLLNESAGRRNVAVMADRSRATASLASGELEFLVHRRLVYDDGRGVGEALDEVTRIITTSRLVMNSATVDDDMRFNALLMAHPPIVRFGLPSAAAKPFKHFSRPMADVLPANVHLHTRTVLAPGVAMLRLQHLFAVGESKVYNHDVTVNLGAALGDGTGAYVIRSVVETDVNGVVDRSDIHRLPFKMCVDGSVETIPADPFGPKPEADPRTVTLKPMEIRTFRVEFEFTA
jgi:hypothetical protein